MIDVPRPIRTILAILVGDPDGCERALAGLTDEDWVAALVFADEERITPAVHAALSGSSNAKLVPPDAADYLAEIARLNRLRNRRIREQLLEVVAVLNGAGIEPVLLKGTNGLLEDRGEAARRVMLDIDLLLDPAEINDARRALAAIGYQEHSGHMTGHAFGYVVRPGEPAVLDLHREPINWAHLLSAADLRARAARVDHDGATALMPSREDRLTHIVLHEMVHHHAHMKGVIGMHAVLDFARFTAAYPELDWTLVLDRLARRKAAHVLRAQALAAHRLLGARVPEKGMAGMAARLFYRRGIRYWQRPYSPQRPPLVRQFGKLLAYPFDPVSAVVPLPVWIGRAVLRRIRHGADDLAPGLAFLPRGRPPR